MKTLPVFLLTLSLLVASPTVLAQDASGSPLDEKPDEPQEPVVMPDYEPATEASQIVIRPGEDVVYYEYRVRGEIREIKVVPDVGPSYYLVPAEGGGWIREGETSLLVPSWVLFRW
jgi:hypothetical protein